MVEIEHKNGRLCIYAELLDIPQFSFESEKLKRELTWLASIAEEIKTLIHNLKPPSEKLKRK